MALLIHCEMHTIQHRVLDFNPDRQTRRPTGDGATPLRNLDMQMTLPLILGAAIWLSAGFTFFFHDVLKREHIYVSEALVTAILSIVMGPFVWGIAVLFWLTENHGRIRNPFFRK